MSRLTCVCVCVCVCVVVEEEYLEVCVEFVESLGEYGEYGEWYSSSRVGGLRCSVQVRSGSEQEPGVERSEARV